MMNQHWARWIFASVCKHFDAKRGTIPMFVEGQQRVTRSLQDFIELRLDGPDFNEASKDYWSAYVEINVMIQSSMVDTDFHRIHRTVGVVSAAFTSAIPIYKYGTAPLIDTGAQIGCLSLVDDKYNKERIKVRHFGQVNPDTQLMQASVEGHYEMYLDA
jgi:hypothetical protein